ncbi:hypothetical protein FEM03_12595 [Phragmitibacter flavus]|uniref:Solute-binding protein family 5 domain-containing protein n=1 Tax=Phragmitibacter flavus TaxID=2576071 RepID=A0A5R8KE23_9BACT|nr:ABC transporter substrate-binding protein [Phragmitibacter flavus]TLD70556.1 hypothetical protein FEM03_12595 [Phragmitibacter flavus]
MLWTRWIIFGLPTLLALLIVWAALQSVASRDSGGDELVVASGEGVPPTLNPFLPMTTVDREVAALVHEPLLRIGATGELEGALASSWSWTQQTRFWFSNASFATKAAAKLKALSPEQWQLWQLQEAVAVDAELRLQLSAVNTTTGPAVHELISEFGPLPVEVLRVELNGEAREHHEFFMSGAVEAAQVKGVRFEGSTAYELQVSGETVKFFEELNKYFRNLPDLEARLRFVRRVPMQDRPRLEWALREDAVFQDGSAVTAADVEASVNLVLSQGWPVDGVEALRLIEAWDTSAPRRPRVTFREVYGPALMAFVDLPVLPHRWVEAYAKRVAAGENPFIDLPPVGAGIFQLDGDVERSLFLSRKGGGARVQFLLDQNPMSIRAGFAMNRVDVFWPGSGSTAMLDRERGVTLRSAPPRNRLLVMWNCRKAPLNDLRVREALALGLDREALVQEWLQGQGSVVEGIFQPGLWFAANVPNQAVDRAKARQMLYDAGWVPDAAGMLSKNGSALRIELLTVAGNAQRINLATRLQELWRELGVELVVKAVPWDEMLDRQLPSRQFDAALMGLNFERSWDQMEFWHSSRARRGMNFAGIEDGGLDTLLTALRVEQDPVKVGELAQDLETRLLALHPFLSLFAGGNVVALRENALPETQIGNGFNLRQILEAQR